MPPLRSLSGMLPRPRGMASTKACPVTLDAKRKPRWSAGGAFLRFAVNARSVEKTLSAPNLGLGGFENPRPCRVNAHSVAIRQLCDHPRYQADFQGQFGAGRVRP